jgi:hypothetical protein
LIIEIANSISLGQGLASSSSAKHNNYLLHWTWNTKNTYVLAGDQAIVKPSEHGIHHVSAANLKSFNKCKEFKRNLLL